MHFRWGVEGLNHDLWDFFLMALESLGIEDIESVQASTWLSSRYIVRAVVLGLRHLLNGLERLGSSHAHSGYISGYNL